MSPIRSGASCFRFCALLASGLMAGLGGWAQSADSGTYYFNIFAGAQSAGSVDGIGTAARFDGPSGIAMDSHGNIFIADTKNHTIRKITPDGTTSTVAGLAGVTGSQDGTGSAARFQNPGALATDSADNIFVADTGNSVIRKITPAGVVTTFAGSAGEQGTTDGLGAAARFQNPLGLTLSVDGNLYVTDDSGDFTITYIKRDAKGSSVRKITPSGVVTTFATGLSVNHYSGSGSANKPAFSVITSDANGNIVVASTDATSQPSSDMIEVGQNIIRYAPNGTATSLLSLTARYSRRPGDFPLTGLITDLLVDRAGGLTVAESNQISRYDLSALPTLTETIMIGGKNGYAASLFLGTQLRLASDRSGNLLLADTYENAVRRLSPALVLANAAGLSALDCARSVDGPGGAARFHNLDGLCADKAGNIYAADESDNVIRKITSAGVVTTLAGQAGTSGKDNGPGANARFSTPTGIAVDNAGQVYVADFQNSLLRKISPTGETTNFSGSGDVGFRDGDASTAAFNSLVALTTDGAGNLYVSDTSTIRKVSLSSGAVTTLAGAPGVYGLTNGQGSEAHFYDPRGLAMDAPGNIYVADTGNSVIRKVSPAGEVTTFAGSPNAPGHVDGKVADARFLYPTGLAFDTQGNLFVADSGNRVLRKITPAGDVSTVPELFGAGVSTEGVGDQARLRSLLKIVSDPSGNLFVGSDTALIKVVPAGPPAISGQPSNQTAAPGGTVQFSVTASGVPAPTYQWYFNGGAFAGATSATLSLSNARSTDAGDYTVVVSNSLGSVTSSKATLTITSAPSPAAPGPNSAAGGGMIGFGFALAVGSLGVARKVYETHRRISLRTGGVMT